MEEQKINSEDKVLTSEIDAIKELHIQLITRLAVIEGILVKKNIISLQDISQEEELVLQELRDGFGQSEG